MLEPVTDKILMTSLDDHVSRMIEDGRHVRQAWWAVKGRAAVPIESGMHFVESQAEAIASAMKYSGCDELFVVALEDTGEDRYLKLASTSADLLELSRRLHMYYLALLPIDGSFVILCSPDDYIVIAGPERFVKHACGGDIDKARATYRDWAFDGRLKAIASRYGA